MELGNTRRREEACPKLLDLIPKDTEWLLLSRDNEDQSHGERKPVELSLGLGPPGRQHDWSPRPNNTNSLDDHDHHHHHRLLSLAYSAHPQTTLKTSSFLHQTTEITTTNNNKKKKPTFSPPQKRTAQAQMVGWPPIRSFRKNLATNPSSSSKPIATDSSQDINTSNNKNNNNNNNNNDVDNNVVNNNGNNISNDNNNNNNNNKKSLEVVESCGKRKGMFVKINMDGVPIGRKVDLSAYDNYYKLSSVVDQLFRGLLAAQRDSSEEKAITGLLDGSGEYTLVYEDNEGDRMLVGDVPWNMFVSTVKRLRVLKSSELSALSLISGKQGEMK